MIRTIRHSDYDKWARVLAKCPYHDTYHTWQYNNVCKDTNREPVLLAYYCELTNYHIALPLLAVKGGAESVYGYPGPAASHLQIPGPVVASFQEELQEYFEGLIRYVITRLNPVLDNAYLLDGLMEITYQGDTTGLDLSASFSPSKGHKAEIAKAQRESVLVGISLCPAYSDLDDFQRMYIETMERVGADDAYLFPKEYFYRLRDNLMHRLVMLTAYRGGKPVSRALFFHHSSIAEYHLSASTGEGLRCGATKAIISQAYTLFRGQGCDILHLGGGVGGDPKSSLFRFKKGFGGVFYKYCIATWERKEIRNGGGDAEH